MNNDSIYTEPFTFTLQPKDMLSSILSGNQLGILAFMGLSLLVLIVAVQTLLRAQTMWMTLTLPVTLQAGRKVV
jgi:hypothetical protein